MSNLFEIKVKTRQEGDVVLTELSDIIDLYGQASVSDLYDLVGLLSVFADTKFGWRSKEFRDATLRRTRDGYIVSLPQTVNLNAPVIPKELDLADLGLSMLVKAWQLDVKGNILGDPDIYAGTLEAFWHNGQESGIKLHGLAGTNWNTKNFRIEVTLNQS